MEEESKDPTNVAAGIPEKSASNETAQEQPEAVAAVKAATSADNSDYDSAGSYSDDEEAAKVPARGSQSDLESEGSVILEREEGDGQESLPSKKVDDDEDKKNPQYIPKRGTFYEHDDRTADDDAVVEAEPEKLDKDGKKKVWSEKKEKWSHDRFNDTEQAPKSRSELVSIYGYDIRNEEGPPRARRRRRYGRGPNKYTRNWEDEDAYNKPAPVNKVTKKPTRARKSSEEFPPLRSPTDNAEPEDEYQEQEQSHSRQYYDRSESLHEANGNPGLPKQPIVIENSNSQDYPPINKRIGTGRVINKTKPREIKDSDYRGFTSKTRQVRNIKSDQQKVLPPRNQKRDDFIHTQNFTNKNNNLQDLDKEMGKLSMQDGGGYKGKHNNQRQGSVPPRLQSEQQKGSKRYSNMRQRSLPESANPPNFPTSFYPTDYNAQAPPPASQQPILPQIHPATTQQVTQLPPASLPPIPQQVPVTAAPLLQPPFPSPFPQAPPQFLQPGVAPPPFIPPQTPQIINYVQGQPPFNPNFQGYQQQFSPVVPTQPTELYQPQGGITYYSTDQQVAPRPVPLKRPKAAIPIVAPPNVEAKGGRTRDDVMPDVMFDKIDAAIDGPVADVQ